MNKVVIIIKYLSAYLFIGLAIGSYFPIITFYLEKELQLNGSQIGLIMAFTTIIPILFLPLWGVVTDTLKSPKTTLIVALFFTSILVLLLSFINQFYVFFIIILVFNIFKIPIFSLFDEILITVCNERNINFGIFRAGCSFGVSVSAFVGFSLAERFGNYRIFLILCGIFYFIAFLIILNAKNVSHKENEKLHLKTDLPILLKNKAFIIMCFIWAITYGVLDANFSYMSNYLNKITHNNNYISLAIFLSVFIEVIVLTLSKYLYKRASAKTIIISVNIISILRYTIIYLFPSYITILALAPLHGVTFGLTYPMVIQFISKNVSKKVLSTAYTVYNALVAFFTASISFYTGRIMDLNVLYIFILFITLSSINGILILVLMKKKSFQVKNI